jgi:hypothetical protein
MDTLSVEALDVISMIERMPSWTDHRYGSVDVVEVAPFAGYSGAPYNAVAEFDFFREKFLLRR